MATYVKVNDFVEHLNEGVHNMASHQLVVALSNTAPGSEGSNPLSDGNGVLANVTQVAYTNLSTRNITLSSSAQCQRDVHADPDRPGAECHRQRSDVPLPPCVQRQPGVAG